MTQAWMAIGTLARLEHLRMLTQDQIDTQDIADSSRCYWSVFILERAFFPQGASLKDTEVPIDYPPSCPVPPSISPPTGPGSSFDIPTSGENINDLGINAYLIKITSIWGEIAGYLRKARSGRPEIPWSPESSYVRLNMRLHEYESQIPHSHLVRNLCLSQRLRGEMDELREYWRPWVMMQIISHSSSAMLNHPMIHLFAMKGRTSLSQSSNFLQQTVDQAIFHAGWVFRLVRTCEDLEFEFNDPFIGHLVAATATIPWIFQFAKDRRVSLNAEKDMSTCARLLSQVSSNWPAISLKV